MGGRQKSVETAKGGKKRGKDARAERLAAALRANLKRRKQQVRMRGNAANDAPAKLAED